MRYRGNGQATIHMETLDMKIERNDAAVLALKEAKIIERKAKRKTVRVRDYFKIGLLAGCDFSITVDKKPLLNRFTKSY